MTLIGRAVLLSIGAGLLAPFYLNFSGVCLATGHRLSDDEMISAAISKVIGHQTANFKRDRKKGVQPAEIPYDSVEDFIRQNPACCKVGLIPDDVTPGGLDEFLQLIFGKRAGVVWLFYMKKIPRIDGAIEQKPYRDRFVITNCGRPSRDW